jgi:branched-chain amino acid transport system substrate-binding protein
MKRIVALFIVLLATFGLAACGETEVGVDRITVTPPTKVEYIIGEEFSSAGMVVTVIFTDGTDRVLTSSEYTVSGFNSATTGLKTVTVTHEGKTATFGVAVFDPEAEEEALGLNILSVPTQQIYNRQEEFNPAGLSVEVVYNTGRKAVLNSTDYTLSGFVAGVVGIYDVTVTFEDVSTSFYAEVRAVTVQGITDTTIKVGNTAVLAGPLSFVGLPFSYGMRAAFEEVNEAGGIGGREIQYVNRDDEFNGTIGMTNTRQLINEDKVFALVGHFGTPTVSSTLGIIREAGIPMVYAATGVNVLYSERAPLDPVMPVQPIYLTDGRIMTARAINEEVYGAAGNQALPANAKIGVLYTLTDDGVSIKDGIEIEAKTLGLNANFIYSSFAAAETAALSTAIENFRSQGVAAVIVASNQAPFKAAIGVMETLDMEVPVFTSYVNADPTAVDSNTDYGFPIYTNAWVDVFSTSGQADVVDFAAAINGASFLDQPTKDQMLVNSFAIAGYIAAKVFIQGLERVGDDTLTWESFIKAMESAPINIPMGGTVDFGGGKRHGIDAMSLLLFNTTTNTFDKVREIETIGQIRG